MKVTIRPLQVDDASISYKWRNNPDIWRYTSARPDRFVTQAIERDWLCKVLRRTNEKRFAICIGQNDQYIGNVQLTDINNNSAQFHIFIGKPNFHGKGIGQKATLLMLEYAFSELGLVSVYLFVNKNNVPAVKMYEKCGFHKLEEVNEMIKMEKTNESTKG